MVLIIIVSIALSIFSTAVMSYISMAVPIGPWIAPMLVLVASLLFRIVAVNNKNKTIAYVVASSSIGGIMATACGFSFPTLYFLDPLLFAHWLAHPLYFCVVLGCLSAIAGWFGFWIANVIEHKLIVQEQYEFPIGQLIYKMIVAQQQVRKAIELIIGFIGALLFACLQAGLGILNAAYHIPRSITLLPRLEYGFFQIPLIQLDFSILPMLLAIGFIAGHMIALPLLVGALSKIIVTGPLNNWLFPTISSIEFLLAFCSGMVVAGAVSEFIKAPITLLKAGKALFGTSKKAKAREEKTLLSVVKTYLMELIIVCILATAFLTYFGFSFISQIYLLFFTFICTYQIAVIAAQIGLAQLGRFATFVMVPAMFIFSLDFVQLVLLSSFVEIAGGVAADVLFSRKLGQLAHLDHAQLKRYQYLGLLVSSLFIGLTFWVLIAHFQLGSTELFAQKAYARRLLIDAKSFNIFVLVIGFIFGWLLKIIKVHPMLVLGGILMPINISLGLIIGGVLVYLFKDKEEYVPFWSGVFAGNSVWMVLTALIKKV